MSSSETWPRWGSMRSGVVWARTMPELPTAASGCSSWPTPRACDGEKGSGESEKREGGPSLVTVSGSWPTPCATDWKDSTQPGQRRGQLSEAVAHRWPTPTSCDAKSSGSAGYAATETRTPGVTLTDAAVRGLLRPTTPKDGASTSTAGRVLNPRFVEALMGWPAGWTDCGSWETESSLTKPPSPGESCGPVCMEASA
jgi:hypothetical protein